MTEPLDFWNYPMWIGDSRDNPRDPNFEPFWMRPAAEQTANPGRQGTTTHGFGSREDKVDHYIREDGYLVYTGSFDLEDNEIAKTPPRLYKIDGLYAYRGPDDDD